VLTKNNAKFIKSLQLKKYRQKEGLFIVEGEKNILELLKSNFKIETLLFSAQFLPKIEKFIKSSDTSIFEVSIRELATLGSLKTNNAGLAVVQIPAEPKFVASGVQLILDDISDPGNLGTIMRTADWYGIQSIICSEETVELYNPKTISASMGSIFRINIFRKPLTDFLLAHKETAVYGAMLSGENVHKIKFKKNAFVLIGNEANGIGEPLLSFIDHAITIPGKGSAESLNAALATAIICDNIYRDI